jgi:hypothetical protein
MHFYKQHQYVVKQVFSDMLVTASKNASPQSLKMYGKHCRYALAYGNIILWLSAYVDWLHARFV